MVPLCPKPYDMGPNSIFRVFVEPLSLGLCEVFPWDRLMRMNDTNASLHFPTSRDLFAFYLFTLSQHRSERVQLILPATGRSTSHLAQFSSDLPIQFHSKSSTPPFRRLAVSLNTPPRARYGSLSDARTCRCECTICALRTQC
jgi:hypothetical protein